MTNTATLSPVPGYYAQTGEDRILATYFAGVRDGYFAEIGAYDGIAFSNTYHFEQLGWRGVLVEANPMLAEQCRAARPGSRVFACAVVGPGNPPDVTFEIANGDPALSSLSITADMLRRVPGKQVTNVTVPAKSLDAILAESKIPRLDFITVDVEGHEHEILQGFSLDRWTPQIVILERNTHLPDPRIMRLMHSHRYTLDRTTGVNDWFVLHPNNGELTRAYRWRLFFHYYLPKLATAWRPLLRSVLLRVGLLD